MTRSEVLDEAKKCVCGQREQDYGSPENNFLTIANLWNSYLYSGVPEENIPKVITPEDVSVMMILMKTARIRAKGGTPDCYVDIAGYAACGGELHGR